MRLIDADKLEKALEDSCDSYSKTMHFMEFMEYVDEQPTVMIWREVTCDEDGYLHNLPEDGQEILVSYQTYVAADIFVDDGEDGCFLESGECIEVGMVWMPMPEPYEEERK